MRLKNPWQKNLVLHLIKEKLENEFHESPEDIINYILDSFNDHQFLEITRKSSLKTALYRHSGNLMIVKGLEYEIYEIFGHYDYHVDDYEFDFANKTLWFLMYVSADEKRIDLNEIHFQLNECSSVQVSVKKFIDRISSWEKLDKAIDNAKEELTNHFLDSEHTRIEFMDIMDDKDDSIEMEIMIGDFKIRYLLKLYECDRVVTEIEYSFRKALES